MATNTSGGVGRTLQLQAIHYLRKTFTFEDDGVAVTVGVIPAGALILKPISGVQIVTAFDAGTGNVADIGTTADDDLFGTNLALGTADFVPLDEAVGGYRVDAETTIIVTPDLTGTAATAGVGEAVIAFIPDNDG